MSKTIPFPFPLVDVAPDEAMDAWARLNTEGKTAVIVGTDEDLQRHREMFEFGADPARVLDRAAGLRFPADLSRFIEAKSAEREARLRANAEFYAQHLEAQRGLEASLAVRDDVPPSAPPPEAWPQLGALMPAPELVWRASQAGARVHIAVLPTPRSWEAPAWLKLGGWNSCPPAEYQVAALKTWADRYGAVPVVCGGDTLEVRVDRRPASHEEALAIARDHRIFCSDIAPMGESYLVHHAAALLISDWWSFWWD